MGAATTALGGLSADGALDVVTRTAPTLLFLLGITAVAALADDAGVFDAAAAGAARLARGSRLALWMLVVALATATTAVLSLDTTAVLLTPVVLALARRTGSSPVLFALTAVWLANTASLLLPVSNLTNLLALGSLRAVGVDGTAGFVALTWAPALTAVAVTVGLLAVVFRRELRGRFPDGAEAARQAGPVAGESGGDRVLLVVAAVVCVALAPAFLSGVPVHVSALVAAGVLAAVTAWRRRRQEGRRLPRRVLEVPLVLGVLGLFLVVAALDEHGLSALLAGAAGSGDGAGSLLRLAGVGALAANAVDNLPAYLALAPAADGPLRTVALLVGTGAGAVVTPWGSLATLLWAQRCRAAGVDVPWRAFVLRGLVLVPLVVLAAVGALAATT